MKRLKHYAGDANPPIALPWRCRWVRVVDFDPMGILSFVTTGPNPPSSNSILIHEPAQIQLNGKDFIPVYGHSIYRPDYDKTDDHSYWTDIALLGNIEIEYAEDQDADPGPLRFGQVSIPFEFQWLSSFQAVMYLPKNTRSVHIRARHITSGFPLQSMTIQQVTPIVGAAPPPTIPGLQSVWEPGSALRTFLAQGPPYTQGSLGPVRPSLSHDILPSQGRLFTLPAPTDLFGCAVNLTESSPSFDDAANNTFWRPFVPTIGLGITANDGSVNRIIVFRGHVNCSY